MEPPNCALPLRCAVMTREDDPREEFRFRSVGARAPYAFTDRANYERLRKDAGASIYLIVGDDNFVATNRPPAAREAAQTPDLASR
ncbi:MAG TPA: hypothetical protein VI231_04925 [Candidatus Binatia bacterium]